jgi:hypothetical protein
MPACKKRKVFNTTMDFRTLKNLSGKKILEETLQEYSSLENSSKRGDNRFWTPTVDKAGNGYAIIRFLPRPSQDGETSSVIQLWDHGFKGPSGLWYIENSLTTIDQNDPVSEYNSKLWNSTTDNDAPARKQARIQKRRKHYITNIFVVSDPANPETEGKVFLYKFGTKIFAKLQTASKPLFPGEIAISPTDLWKGANFLLKIRHEKGFRNYDSSEFDKSSIGPLHPDDEKLKKIYESEYPLQPFLSSSNFKTYAELKEKLARVLAEPMNDVSSDETSPWETPPAGKSIPQHKPRITEDDDDDMDDMSYFKDLAE